MKTYLVYIKSHCEAPDYEDWCEAKSKKKAVNMFLMRGLGNAGWEYPEVYKNVEREDYL